MFRLRIASILAFCFALIPCVAAQETAPSPENNTIVYIASESRLLETSPSSGQPLIEAANAQPVSTWHHVLETARSRDIVALVIDQSALDEVDWDAVAALYEQGVVIATINVPVEEMAALIDDPRLTDDGFAAEPYPGSYFIIASHLVLGHFLEYRACVREASEEACARNPMPNLNSPVYITSLRAQNTLDTDFDLMVFGIILRDHVQDIASLQQCFAGGTCEQVPATPPG